MVGSSLDSPLEEAGFEPSVPPQEGTGSPAGLIEIVPQPVLPTAKRTVRLLVRIRFPPAASPSLQCIARLRAKSPALSRPSAHGWRRETGWADCNPALVGVFSLTGVDAVPSWGGANHVQRRVGRGDNRGWGISSFCGLGSEKPVLLGPVERQVELGQTRRGKLDRLPALQDCLDQLWAQEGQTNKTPDVAPADAVAFGQLLQRSRAAGEAER